MQDKEEGNSAKREKDNDEELEAPTRSVKRAKKNPELAELGESVSRLRNNDVTLRQLDFGYRGIGLVEVKVISVALMTNTVLVQLSLWGNQIGDEGAKAVGEALAINGTLLQLHLGDNRIGDRGVEDLSTGLATNTTLTQLDLRDNKIGAFGVNDR